MVTARHQRRARVAPPSRSPQPGGTGAGRPAAPAGSALPPGRRRASPQTDFMVDVVVEKKIKYHFVRECTMGPGVRFSMMLSRTARG